ncbi:MAG TPA: MarR family transcriptional regulator [Solirubrobacterales bacterium]|nr:MarR family transcriptional regulator [Solirubrobacterales bacterium]
MARPDRVAALVSQWEKERPDLDLETMALAARLLSVGRMIDARIGALAAEHEMTVGEGDILLTLRRSGPPYRLLPTQLTESLLVSSGTMTSRLDRLERRGLVERVPNPEDRRSVEIALTESGRKLVDAVVGEHVAREQEMLAPLSSRERDSLTRILRKLAAHIEAL